MHIINPHRRHTNRALTLKCIAHIWTSGGLSIDCSTLADKLGFLRVSADLAHVVLLRIT